MKTNVPYYGDNLEILRDYIPAESVDLIYLDPPFNSQQQYNVLFKEPTGQGSTAQIRAFTDTWHWDMAAEKTYLWEREFPRIQIFTVAELLEGKQPELPGRVSGFARAPRLGGRARQIAMSETGDG